LIEDVINRRCRDHPLFGVPARISTVDKFQGQQNDYILLSLVRTRTAGHIRDVRRLVVAMSRARLGLFVFGRETLYRNCYELTPAFNRLVTRPTKLIILPHEKATEASTTTSERALETPMESLRGITVVEDVKHMGLIVATLTKAAEAEKEEYQRKVQKFEDEKRKKEEEKLEKLRMVEEQKRQIAREEADAKLTLIREKEQQLKEEMEEELPDTIIPDTVTTTSGTDS